MDLTNNHVNQSAKSVCQIVGKLKDYPAPYALHHHSSLRARFHGISATIWNFLVLGETWSTLDRCFCSLSFEYLRIINLVKTGFCLSFAYLPQLCMLCKSFWLGVVSKPLILRMAKALQSTYAGPSLGHNFDIALEYAKVHHFQIRLGLP